MKKRMAVIVCLSLREELIYRTATGDWVENPLQAQILPIEQALELIERIPAPAVGLLSWVGTPPFLECHSEFPLMVLGDVCSQLNMSVQRLYQRILHRGVALVRRGKNSFVRQEDIPLLAAEKRRGGSRNE